VVGEAAAGAKGRLGGGVEGAVKFGGPHVKKCQETSRVVKRKLDGVLSDINDLRTSDWTFDAAGGGVKEGEQERGRTEVDHSATLAQFLILRKSFGRCDAEKQVTKAPAWHRLWHMPMEAV